MRRAAAGRHRAGAAGLDELAQPGAAHPRADRRRARAITARCCRARDSSTRMCAICCGQVGLPPEVGGHVSARAVRRHEAARLHRHRDLPAPQGDHRRRADQRARRGRAAPGDGHARPRAAGTGRRGDAGRPRHGADGAVRRPARRDVCRPAGGGRADRRDHHGAAASLHADADRQPALAGAEGDDAGHSRAGAAAARPAARLRLPSALPACRRRAAASSGRSCAAVAAGAQAACHLA